MTQMVTIIIRLNGAVHLMTSHLPTRQNGQVIRENGVMCLPNITWYICLKNTMDCSLQESLSQTAIGNVQRGLILKMYARDTVSWIVKP